LKARKGIFDYIFVIARRVYFPTKQSPPVTS
jgi:hypothetical protein